MAGLRGDAFRSQDPETGVLDASISMGLNIYKYSRKIIEDTTASIGNSCVRTAYGFYQGGDVSTGGGEPVSLDPWLANPDL